MLSRFTHLIFTIKCINTSLNPSCFETYDKWQVILPITPIRSNKRRQGLWMSILAIQTSRIGRIRMLSVYQSIAVIERFTMNCRILSLHTLCVMSIPQFLLFTTMSLKPSMCKRSGNRLSEGD